ncbi:hypothetical protein ACYPKM_01015 [Pseudomonas aeruginosa]
MFKIEAFTSVNAAALFDKLTGTSKSLHLHAIQTVGGVPRRHQLGDHIYNLNEGADGYLYLLTIADPMTGKSHGNLTPVFQISNFEDMDALVSVARAFSEIRKAVKEGTYDGSEEGEISADGKRFTFNLGFQSTSVGYSVREDNGMVSADPSIRHQTARCDGLFIFVKGDDEHLIEYDFYSNTAALDFIYQCEILAAMIEGKSLEEIKLIQRIELDEHEKPGYFECLLQNQDLSKLLSFLKNKGKDGDLLDGMPLVEIKRVPV